MPQPTQGKLSFCYRTPGPGLKYSSLSLFKCKVLWILGILLIINSKEAEAQGAFPATKDVYGEIGESVTLPCSLESEVISHVQWSRGEEDIYSSITTANNGFYSAEIAQQFAIVGDRKTEFALKVNSLSATDVPQLFRCSPFGSRRTVITVKKPNLSVKLIADNEANLVAGQTRVVLTCNATGADPTDVKFEWSQKGNYVPSSQTSPSGTVDSNAFISTLTLDPLRYSDDAEFTCTVSNGYYKDRKAKALKKTLSVQFPPMEAPDHLGREKEDNIYVAEGTENQAFKIPYIANPGTLGGATYEWTKDGSSALPDGVRGSVDTTHVYLTFEPIKDEFYGEYMLKMTNSVGSNDVTTAALGKPDERPTPKPVTKGGLSGGAIAGIVIGVLVLLGLLLGLAYWCFKNRRAGAAEGDPEVDMEPPKKKKGLGQPEEISMANPMALSEPPTPNAGPGDGASGRSKPTRPPRRSESGPRRTENKPRGQQRGSETEPGPAAHMPVYTGRAEEKPVYRGPDDKPVYKGPDDKPVYRGPNDKPVYRGPDDKPVYKGPDDQPIYKGPEDKPVYKGSGEKPMYPGADKPAPASRVYGNVDPPGRRHDDYVVQYNRDHGDWEEGTEGLAYADVAVTKPLRPAGQPDPVHAAPETVYTAIQPTLV